MSYTESTPCLKDDAHVHCGYRWKWIIESRLAAFIFGALLYILVCSGIILTVSHDRARAAASVARPKLFVRLAGVEGLDPCSSLPSPPIFHLVVDADGVSSYNEACSGGGNSMLRVSYHGMILAWGNVPWFCIRGGWRTDGVVTVEAKSEAAVLREEVRSLVWSEQHVVGKTEFDVEGEVAGLGYLHCKTFLFRGNMAAENEGLCLVQ